MRRSLVSLSPHLTRPRRQPLVAGFLLTPEQAEQKFLSWQRNHWLAPRNALNEGHEIKPLYLPFWLFNITARLDHTAHVGFTSNTGTVRWKKVEQADEVEQTYSYLHPSMHVYADYKYRRDYVDALGFKDLLQHGIANAGISDAGYSHTSLPLPAMRESIAWEFALRQLRQAEQLRLVDTLKKEHSADKVKEVRVNIRVSKRQAQLAYFPVYAIKYTYGETFNVHGERKPEQFLALVSGAGTAGVAAERHLSAGKAAGVGSTCFAALTLAGNQISGLPRVSLLSVENIFGVCIAGCIAALGTRIWRMLQLQMGEERRIEEENTEFENFISYGMSPLEPGHEYQQTLRSDAEWKRWENSDLHSWRETKRQHWAEALWKTQNQRRLERLHQRQKLIQQQARREEEEVREQRRRKRWGHSSHHHTFRQQAPHASGGGRNRDPRGYYRVLGLDSILNNGDVTQAAIKKAYRQLALRWHPDRHAAVGEKAKAKEAFHVIKSAYDVLGNPEQRKLYDRGELPRHS